MSNIAVCYKWVADESDIRIGDDLSVDVSNARHKISDFDRSAIEAAMTVAQDTDNTVVTLTYGTADVKSSLKDALSRGPEKSYWIASDTAGEADGRRTSKALAAGVKAIGDVSLVFCAEGSSDVYARQVGPRIGADLDWPVITSVESCSLEGTTLTARRKLEDVMQTVQVETPAVVCVLAEGFEPRVPGLKAIMSAGKKPNTQLDAESLDTEEALAQSDELKGFAMSRKNLIIIEEDMAVAAEELAKALRAEGVLQ